MALSIHMDETEGVTILRLGGKLVFGEERDELRTCLDRLLGEGKTKIAIDMKGIIYIDDSITTLIPALVSTKKQGGSIKVVSPSKCVQEVLFPNRLNQVIEVYDTEEEALASFNQPKNE